METAERDADELHTMNKELPPVFPASTGEVERAAEPAPPTAMSPEHPNHRQCIQVQHKMCLILFVEAQELEKYLID
ncbi:hypothetical protein AVEN_218233-1 [Araneus ventricosus]|uniref:Uncharacterized protein n=1 Tax=Araneus ventricosus TaxID=182803 RepID=A0A4Y2LKM9_ARAVE|nr:hypothetical protein AVEN_218233-1 [Araneus ventricosus]